MELLGDAAHAPRPAAKNVLAQLRARAEHRLGLVQQPAQHAHAIPDQATIGRIMDGGLDDRAIYPQFPSTGHFAVLGQFHHPRGSPAASPAR